MSCPLTFRLPPPPHFQNRPSDLDIIYSRIYFIYFYTRYRTMPTSLPRNRKRYRFKRFSFTGPIPDITFCVRIGILYLLPRLSNLYNVRFFWLIVYQASRLNPEPSRWACGVVFEFHHKWFELRAEMKFQIKRCVHRYKYKHKQTPIVLCFVVSSASTLK